MDIGQYIRRWNCCFIYPNFPQSLDSTIWGALSLAKHYCSNICFAWRHEPGVRVGVFWNPHSSISHTDTVFVQSPQQLNPLQFIRGVSVFSIFSVFSVAYLIYKQLHDAISKATTVITVRDRGDFSYLLTISNASVFHLTFNCVPPHRSFFITTRSKYYFSQIYV